MTKEELLQLHEDTCNYCRSIMKAKNTDYTGGSDDPFANFRISEAFGVHPVIGILMRLSDKMQRIKAFVANGKMAVAAESADDACDDIINYAVLIKGMFHEAAENPLLAYESVNLTWTGHSPQISTESTCSECGCADKEENFIYGTECLGCGNHEFITK